MGINEDGRDTDMDIVSEGKKAAAAPPAFKKRVAAGKNFRRRGKDGKVCCCWCVPGTHLAKRKDEY